MILYFCMNMRDLGGGDSLMLIIVLTFTFLSGLGAEEGSYIESVKVSFSSRGKGE